MNKLVLTIGLVLCLASDSWAQNNPTTTEPQGSALKIAEILGEFNPVSEDEISFLDLAVTVKATLAAVDRDLVGDLNRQLQRLEMEEKELLEKLQASEKGEKISVDWDDAEDPLADIDEYTLQAEEASLEIQRAKIRSLELLRAEQEQEKKERQKAKEISKFSKALLGTLETLPKPETSQDLVEEQTVTKMPVRLGRAKFRARDFTGALRAYNAIPIENRTFRDRYEMARCYESQLKFEAALQMLAPLIKDTDERDPFWNQRAKNLSKYVEQSQTIETTLNGKEKS